MSVPPHDRILEAATRLFLREGIRAVGMTRIAAEAGVAPMTIYRRFGGKDRLVAAMVEDRSKRSLRWLADRIERCGEDPEAGLQRLWDVLEEWLAAEELPGSLVTSVATELRGRLCHPAHAAVEAHRAALRRLLEELAIRAGAVDPPRLAGQLQFLVESTVAAAVVDGWPARAESVRALADAALLADSPR
ncbi:MAG TPA: helix-turn-helix domain-containing protein [Actinomycetota bacterium]|nr:helix-turn-helix domain-containing protein [Actinomycetota bacterium]